MKNRERIITFRQFDTLIQANLAKTKLDAYGVPCFLADEHFGSLYPIHNDIFPGVRLYIFENDLLRANELMEEEGGEMTSSDELQCPRCESGRVSIIYKPLSLFQRFINDLRNFFFLKSSPVAFKCLNCNHEFSSQ